MAARSSRPGAVRRGTGRVGRGAGPVVIVDEAENPCRSGVSRVDRRTALRSLAFDCGGTLARACVATALTPASLESLRGEGPALLDEVSQQRDTLAWEDSTMFSRRLSRTRPTEAAVLTADDRVRLALRLYALHERVRGEAPTVDLEAVLEREIANDTPRALARAVVNALERERS